MPRKHDPVTPDGLTGPGKVEAPVTDSGPGARLRKARLKRRLFSSDTPAIKAGRFTLIERLGRGGMGEVYAAYDDTLDRKVAIKLVRPCATAGASVRLIREAKVLARLAHPNVVHVYDVGTIDDQVFVAMEFIRGQTVRAWLDGLAPEPGHARWRRIRDVFVQAGNGLLAAHRAGLVHRDIKPDNVLVSHDGRVLLVDFGLARPVDAAPEAATRTRAPEQPADVGPGVHAGSRFTETGAILGTPAYMAPEQRAGQACDPRSDQFSFCATLYEALYGTRPSDAPAGRDGRAGRAGHNGRDSRGAGVPSWLRQALMRGLAPEPADRFAGMSQLLDALTRDTRRRKRSLGLAAALGVTGMILGAGLWQSARPAAPPPCAAAAAELQPLWNVATRQRIEQAFAATGVPYAATAWTRAAAELDRYVAGWHEERVDACEDTHLRYVQSDEILGLRQICLDRHQRALSATLDQLARADATTVEHALPAIAALPPVTSCRDGEALLLGVRPPMDAQVAHRVDELRAALAGAQAVELAGHRRQALDMALPLVDAAERTGYAPVQAEALFTAGRALLLEQTREQAERGERMLWDALDRAESHRHDELAAEIWNHLVRMASHRDATQERARLLSRRALAAVARVANPDPRRIEALANLGRIHHREHAWAEAESHHRQALALAEATADQRPAGALIVAERLQELASTVRRQNRDHEARALYERALAVMEAELGAAHPRVARLCSDMALFFTAAGDLPRARALTERAMAIITAVHGATHMDAGVAALSLANIEQELGQLDSAREHARAALEVYGTHLDPTHPDMAEPWLMLGLVDFRRQDFDAALQAWERALAIQRLTLPDDDLALLLTRSNIGEALVALGRHDAALAAYADIEPAAAALAGDMPVVPALVHKGQGLALLGQGRLPAAERALARARDLLSRESGYALERADVLWALARVGRDLGRGPAMHALAREAMAIYDQHGREEDGRDIRAWLAR